MTACSDGRQFLGSDMRVEQNTLWSDLQNRTESGSATSVDIESGWEVAGSCFKAT